MEQVIADAMWAPRASMTLMIGFASLAALLAASGIVGVVSYIVAARTQEIGVRIALGAASPSIVWMVVRQAMRPILTGGAVGLAAAVLSARALASLLYGVKPDDPAILAAVTVLTITASCLAAFVPARRAASADPLLALRAE
jgi:ABC-type antimicrobial peptide transport system permease subunit